tara:strand:+ start:142 stop:588 length:447 start_codon:yes stop_codon:yes gene_type:complete
MTCVQRVQQSGIRPRRNEPSGPQKDLPTVVLTVGTVDVVAEVADDPSKRAFGLMFRDALAPDAGMVFVYPSPRPLSFWMRNTCLPLSIAYLDASGRIVSIADMTPLAEQGVPSGSSAQYALEMEQGWFARKGVSVGDSIVGLPPASTY